MFPGFIVNVLGALRSMRDHHQGLDLGRDGNDRSFREEVRQNKKCRRSYDVKVNKTDIWIRKLDDRFWKFPQSFISLWRFSIIGLVSFGVKVEMLLCIKHISIRKLDDILCNYLKRINKLLHGGIIWSCQFWAEEDDLRVFADLLRSVISLGRWLREDE